MQRSHDRQVCFTLVASQTTILSAVDRVHGLSVSVIHGRRRAPDRGLVSKKRAVRTVAHWPRIALWADIIRRMEPQFLLSLPDPCLGTWTVEHGEVGYGQKPL